MNEHYLAWINTPFGSVTITQRDAHLRIELLTEAISSNHQPSNDTQVMAAYNEITLYLQDPNYQCHFPLSTDGTEFQRHVWRAIYAIPAGETRSYGQLAATLGSGARAVANACGANQLPLIIPCHRVVAQHGIGGFMQGKANGGLIKQWLLQHEGVLSYA